MNTTECTAIKVGPTQWMVRRWKPPLTEEKLNPYLTGGMLAPYPHYVEALVTDNFTGSGEAIKAAIARNSWA